MNSKLQHTCLAFFIFFFMLPVGINAQDDQQKIIKAITSGNARELVKHFHTTVNLSVPGNDGVYNRSQAEILLQGFFSKNKILSFKINHQGQSREGTRFLIGLMACPAGKFNIYYLMKEMDGQEWIIQFQIEVSDD
jgi:hypothetical protein